MSKTPIEQLKEDALAYHASAPSGKIEVIASKPCQSQQDLTLAYTPGVAMPCLEIKANPENSWKYTARANLVAVVSDGTAVLGLGNIGPEAGMPVMEGKAVLFKRFAGIDSIPICLGNVFTSEGKTDPKKLIETVQRLEPSFGGINLEDIAAPACFEVEQTLKKTMKIPVFHDDQHGTAIISLAAIRNAVELLGKSFSEVRIVFSGAGAAAIACAEFYVYAGAKRENIMLVDIEGVIHADRPNLTSQHQRFAVKTKARTLADALVGADVFMGLSAAGLVKPEMVRTMAKDPVVFAMANPTPEIMPDEAMVAGAAIVGSGRSDFPNQINNVSGFPGIFRGALDVRASDINDEMKLAASNALAVLARMPVSGYAREILNTAYPKDAAQGMFDGECPLKKTLVIPKPFDPRLVPMVARYVAEAAMKSGVAQIRIDDLDAYQAELTTCLRR